MLPRQSAIYEMLPKQSELTKCYYMKILAGAFFTDI